MIQTRYATAALLAERAAQAAERKRERDRTRAPRVRESGRDKRKRSTVGEIIAWDGEGLHVEPGVPQPYVYLANSLGGSWIDTNSGVGLSTRSIVTALLDTARLHRRATHFMFGSSYDINQFLKDIPEADLRELWANGKVTSEPYFIMYRPRKMFYVKMRGYDKGITLWDAWPFFQSSFVKAIRKYLGADYVDLEMIERMKAQRSQFDVADLPNIERYTQAELRALVLLVHRILGNLHDAGIYPRRYDGPGAVAAELLRSNNVKSFMADTPAAVRKAGAIAYSGGRIETLQYGTHVAPTYHYDINSAYPSAMLMLPALAGGSWAHIRNPDRQDTDNVLYRLRWGDDAAFRSAPRPHFYPFSYRSPQTGSIYYPEAGESWVWGPEYHAYLDHQEAFGIQVQALEAYRFDARYSVKPFAWVAEKYALRQQWKREGVGAEYAIKLGLNSLYGKLAQTVGWTADKMPPYYQIEWAGLITSHTRATMLRAAVQRPESVIMFATDGIFTIEPLDLDINTELGGWSEQVHDAITVVQSGVYFVRDGTHSSAYTRGYHYEKASPEETDDARDARYLDDVTAGWKAGLGSIPVAQERYITLGTALASRRISSRWRSWVSEPRSLSLQPVGKRIGRGKARPWERLERSSPASIFESSLFQLSAPYSRAWREELLQEKVNGIRVDIYEAEAEEAAF